MVLVEKVRSTAFGISSTEIANQLVCDARRQIIGTLSLVSADDINAIEKNIRRRLYDSLKVLISIGAIHRSRKDKVLFWQGISHLVPSRFTTASSSPRARLLNTTLCSLRKRLRCKTAHLHHAGQRLSAIAALHKRNRLLPTRHQLQHIHMPFVLLRTPHTTDITLDATKDTRFMSFDLSDNFEIVNDFAILNRLFCVKVQARKRPSHLPPGHISDPQIPLVPIPAFRQAHAFANIPLVVDAAPPLQSSIIPPEFNNGKWTDEDMSNRSPQRSRVPSVSPFAKFTSDVKPLLSLRIPTAVSVRRSSCRGLHNINYTSPLQESLRALVTTPKSPQNKSCIFPGKNSRGDGKV